MFGIVLKFHSQTTSVEGVITIPVIILKQHAACCFIGLTMNNNIMYRMITLVVTVRWLCVSGYG